jgi:hypothetical protein
MALDLVRDMPVGDVNNPDHGGGGRELLEVMDVTNPAYSNVIAVMRVNGVSQDPSKAPMVINRPRTMTSEEQARQFTVF